MGGTGLELVTPSLSIGGQPFAPVRSGALNPHRCTFSEPSSEQRANANERHPSVQPGLTAKAGVPDHHAPGLAEQVAVDCLEFGPRDSSSARPDSSERHPRALQKDPLEGLGREPVPERPFPSPARTPERRSTQGPRLAAAVHSPLGLA
jgi:hypothetical protein